MPRWPSIAIAFTLEGLMQIHGFAFWQKYVEDDLVGAIWSLALAGAAMWAWWASKTRLAVLVSAVLIAGPFYQLTSPTIDAMRAHWSASRMVALDQAEVNQLTKAEDDFRANSRERTGWARRIDEATAKLEVARERLRASTQHETEVATGWREIGLVALPAVALLLAMLVQIQAVITLRPKPETDPEPKPQPRSKPAPARPAPAPSKSAPIPESDYESLVIAVMGRLSDWDDRGKELADHAGVRAADVSMLRKHAERRAAGKETISKTALRKLADYLGIETITTTGVAA